MELVKTPLLTIPSTVTNGDTFDVIIQVNGDVVQEVNEFFLVTFEGLNSNDVFPAGVSPRLRVFINNDGDGMCVSE